MVAIVLWRQSPKLMEQEGTYFKVNCYTVQSFLAEYFAMPS